MMDLKDQILEFLRLREVEDQRRTQCTSAIAHGVGVTTPTARKELQCMEHAGLVRRYRPWCSPNMSWWERTEGRTDGTDRR